MKRALQIVTALLGLVPIVTGLIAMSGTSDPIYAAAGLAPLPVLDSNLRFFAGVWFGLGVAILWLVPRRHSDRPVSGHLVHDLLRRRRSIGLPDARRNAAGTVCRLYRP
jgi:Domain of unknown function (DUF4345)